MGGSSCEARRAFLFARGGHGSGVRAAVLDMPRRAIVEEIRPQDETSAVVWFKSVDDIDTAKALCGCHVLVRREELPELAQAIAAAHSDGVSGWEVYDAQAGLLGTLLRVEDNPGQSLLVVDRADGNRLCSFRSWTSFWWESTRSASASTSMCRRVF